jgi:hypothetical protein
MLTRGLYLALDDTDLAELKRTKENDARKDLATTWEEEWGTDRKCETDKAWKMLFYVLRDPVYDDAKLRKALGPDFIGHWLADLVDIGSELFYGPNLYKAEWYLLSLVDKRKLPVINCHLSHISPNKFEKRFKLCVRYWLSEKGIVFNRESLRYVRHWLDRITEFFVEAEKANRHLLFSAENC